MGSDDRHLADFMVSMPGGWSVKIAKQIDPDFLEAGLEKHAGFNPWHPDKRHRIGRAGSAATFAEHQDRDASLP
jgi:hypothetical protein